MRARKRRSCSSLPTSSQNLSRTMPASMMYRSISGTSLRKRSTSSGLNEAHDVLDAGAVVPAAVKDDDFAGRRKMPDVALNEHLGLFPLRGRRQCHDTKHARANSLRDRLDGAALPGGVASFEYDDDPAACGLEPILQVAKLDLKLAQLLFVVFALHLAVVLALRLHFFGHDAQLPKITRRNRLRATKK